jgi:hypothetical protein
MKKNKILLLFILLTSFSSNICAQINTDTIYLKKVFFGKKYYYQDKKLKYKKYKELVNSFEEPKRYFNKFKQNQWLALSSCLAALISHITYQRLDRIYPYSYPFYSTTNNGKIHFAFTFALFVPAYFGAFKSKAYFKKSIKAFNKAKLKTF